MSREYNFTVTDTEATDIAVRAIELLKQNVEALHNCLPADDDYPGGATRKEKVEEWLMVMAERYKLTADVIRPGAAYNREKERRRHTRLPISRAPDPYEFFSDIKAERLAHTPSTQTTKTQTSTEYSSDDDDEGRAPKRARSYVASPSKIKSPTPSVLCTPLSGHPTPISPTIASISPNDNVAVKNTKDVEVAKEPPPYDCHNATSGTTSPLDKDKTTTDQSEDVPTLPPSPKATQNSASPSESITVSQDITKLKPVSGCGKCSACVVGINSL